ncbi:MAG: ABC transporter ATP-binding protein [Actinomycetota bacterium]|nr:ABC transporter ATP-binding protein [Actinomycetota bacterium]MDA3013875.1 ABC transporter ATP-binding protein [Actinomycetota bacterium]
MSVIKVENLTVQYSGEEHKALDGVSLEIQKGEFIAILGAHGAGKTTLCLSLNGIVPNMISADMYGMIEVLGEIPPKIPVRQLAAKVGSIFDNPEFQMSQLTVFEEVALGLQNLGVDKVTIEKNIKESLKLVGLEGFEERSPFEISGGQQQRLAMASALAMKPEILILDEPTSNLDPIGKEEVFSVTRKLNLEEGLTVVIAEHEVEVISEFADQVVFLENGKIIEKGTPSEIFPKIVGRQASVGVRVPQVTELASNKSNLFKSIPVTLSQAVEAYKA